MDEWQLVKPLIPPGKPGGGKRTVIMREVVNGLIYVPSTGCQWRAVPKDLPPKSTIYDYFDLSTYDGTLQQSGLKSLDGLLGIKQFPVLRNSRFVSESTYKGPGS